jgi:hypothetical protein
MIFNGKNQQSIHFHELVVSGWYLVAIRRAVLRFFVVRF